jgi:hypothetical protein
MLPALSEAVDLYSCREYFHKYGLNMCLYYDDDDFGNENPNNFYNEGLLHIKLGNYNDFKEKRIQEALDIYPQKIETGWQEYTQEKYEESCKRLAREKPQRLDFYEEMSNNQAWLDKAYNELEHRKSENTERLRSYGLDI